jgi:hypothetical protein
MASSRTFASRLALIALTSIGLAGCYASHVAPDDPRACGDSICTEGNRCCPTCDGRGQCVTLDLRCPDIVCTEECRSNAECSRREYCRVERDVCGGPGRCTPRPTACPADCPGVCGCDGSVYCNECIAASEGVNVQDLSVCLGEACGTAGFCPPGATCCRFCGDEGLCIRAGQMCPVVECPDECFSPFECGFEQVCQFPFGTCGGPGRCVPFPDGCDDDCPGVCGCDGVVYCNDCVALSAGVSVTERELCLQPCGRGGAVCSPAEYCDLGADCGASDGQRCLMRPSFCTDELDPVCGCDGLTYENACSAQAAGVTVRFRGACEG